MVQSFVPDLGNDLVSDHRIKLHKGLAKGQGIGSVKAFERGRLFDVLQDGLPEIGLSGCEILCHKGCFCPCFCIDIMDPDD